MPREALPDLSIALTFLRSGQGWSQADLGKAAGISPKILNDYERGRKTLTRERLEYLVAFLGVPPDEDRRHPRPPGRQPGVQPGRGIRRRTAGSRPSPPRSGT